MTTKHPEARLGDHLSAAYSLSHRPQYSWMLGLRDDGLRPELEIASKHEARTEAWYEEQRLIREHLDTVFNKPHYRYVVR